ncbi:MAG: hypothetical protein HY445_01310 [Candidatus Niyogibacteria bacterium]|nr:hypothetical protein [Candidatus Niyogibacteria bacterium]
MQKNVTETQELILERSGQADVEKPRQEYKGPAIDGLIRGSFLDAQLFKSVDVGYVRCNEETKMGWVYLFHRDL